MQSAHLQSFSSAHSAAKRCRKCGELKALAFFVCDRSRPDGRWHTCRACNRLYWQRWGKKLAAFRRRDKQAAWKSRCGLEGLKSYRRGRNRESFASLPPHLRPVAQHLVNRYRAAHRYRGQAYDALLIACATSNAKRVGDTRWAHRMWRLKGYRRAERWKAAQEAQLAEIRAQDAGKARVAYLPYA